MSHAERAYSCGGSTVTKEYSAKVRMTHAAISGAIMPPSFIKPAPTIPAIKKDHDRTAAPLPMLALATRRLGARHEGHQGHRHHVGGEIRHTMSTHKRGPEILMNDDYTASTGQ